MRHRHEGRQLSRTSAHRKAMLRNLVTSLFEHESVTTTVAKAKEVRPVAERLITLAKRDSLHARRRAGAYIRSDDVNRKLFATIAPWYADRPGGYTRITRVGRRVGDAGEVGIISLVKATGEAAEGAGAPAAAAPKKSRFPRLGWRKKAAAASPAAPQAVVHRNSRKEKREAARLEGTAPKRAATRKRRAAEKRSSTAEK